jgi:hypothetical protein
MGLDDRERKWNLGVVVAYLYGLRIPGEMLAFLERGRLDLSLKSGCEPKCGALLLLLLLLPLLLV